MKEPRWISREAMLLLHSASLARYGGLNGICDNGLLESALGRPQNRFLYDDTADLAALAAAYGYGLARNHAFHDGNKRAALAAVGLFLILNEWDLAMTETEAIQVTFAVAAGELGEEEFAAWIRMHLKKRD